MKIPEKIKIGNREVKIELVNLTEFGLHGQYDPETYIISINSEDSRMAQIETLWHEIIHAVHDYNETMTSIANEIAASQMDGGDPEIRAYNLEEQMTQGFSSIFLQVIKDNKLLNLTE